jgi:hypothetical protein
MVGTIFEDSHIPLRKWLIAWYLLCSSKKGISSLQLQRILELGSYRTALFMAHRIRYALKENGFADKLDGTIEADETLVGGVTKGKGQHAGNKVPVMAMVQRGGSVRSKVMPTVNGANLKQAIRENVKAGAQHRIITVLWLVTIIACGGFGVRLLMASLQNAMWKTNGLMIWWINL